jgi:hypothetical protein
MICSACKGKHVEIPFIDPIRYQCRDCGVVTYPPPTIRLAPTGETAVVRGQLCRAFIVTG